MPMVDGDIIRCIRLVERVVKRLGIKDDELELCINACLNAGAASDIAIMAAKISFRPDIVIGQVGSAIVWAISYKDVVGCIEHLVNAIVNMITIRETSYAMAVGPNVLPDGNLYTFQFYILLRELETMRNADK